MLRRYCKSELKYLEQKDELARDQLDDVLQLTALSFSHRNLLSQVKKISGAVSSVANCHTTIS
jgi:hypothetical protein